MRRFGTVEEKRVGRDGEERLYSYTEKTYYDQEQAALIMKMYRLIVHDMDSSTSDPAWHDLYVLRKQLGEDTIKGSANPVVE